MGKLKIYDLVERFAKSVMWLCDLKSIVRAKEDLKHFKSFCWINFNLIFEHVFGEDFPFSKDSVTAADTAKLLWVLTDQILNCELIHSAEFANHMYPSKVMLNTAKPVNIQNKTMSKATIYQSCVFQKTL